MVQKKPIQCLLLFHCWYFTNFWCEPNTAVTAHTTHLLLRILLFLLPNALFTTCTITAGFPSCNNIRLCQCNLKFPCSWLKEFSKLCWEKTLDKLIISNYIHGTKTHWFKVSHELIKASQKFILHLTA